MSAGDVAVQLVRELDCRLSGRFTSALKSTISASFLPNQPENLYI